MTRRHYTKRALPGLTPIDLPPLVRALLSIPAANVKAKAIASPDADLFEFQLKAHGLKGWIREHRFALEALARNWRFDFANREHRIAFEIEGLRVQNIGGKVVCTGRHSTPDGYREDMRKYNAAAELGWTVLRADQTMVKNGEAIADLLRLLNRRGIDNGQNKFGPAMVPANGAQAAGLPTSLPRRSGSYVRRS